jgi:hypothetical protein
LAFVVIASGALLVSQRASAQVFAAGGVTIYDSVGCSSDVRAAKVTIPFSIGVTGLAPSSSTEIFVTDKDAQPDIVYGPGTFTADQNGNICLDIFDAPPGTWKIDVVEQGSGFTDSKVFTIEGTPAPIISLPSTTTTIPASTTTQASTTTLAPTTTQPSTTTTLAPTTTLATTTTSPGSTTSPPITTPTTAPVAPPVTEPAVTRPFDELPWVIQEVESTSAASIPKTGGTAVIPAAVAVSLLGLGGLAIVTTRHRGHPDAH